MNLQIKNHIFEFIARDCQSSVTDVEFACYLNKIRTADQTETNKKHRIVIDCESCIDRLYGGYFPEWHNGGMWNNSFRFFQEIKKFCRDSKIELILFFNGTTPELSDMQDWVEQQRMKRAKINKIFKTNPGEFLHKNLWVEPIFLREQLIYFTDDTKYSKEQKHLGKLRQETVRTFSSLKNHQKELLQFCKNYNIKYLLTDDMELMTLLVVQEGYLEPEETNLLKDLEIFSAKSFKLSHSGELFARKLDLRKLMHLINFNEKQFGWFSMLCGLTRWLQPKFLLPLYNKIYNMKNQDGFGMNYADYHELIRSIIQFVRENTQPAANFDLIAERLFKDLPENEQLRRITLLTKTYDYIFTIPKFYEDCTDNIEYLNMNEKAPSEVVDSNSTTSGSTTSLSNQDSDGNKAKKFLDIYSLDRHLEECHVNCSKSNWIVSLRKHKRIYLTATLEPEMSDKILRSDEIYRPVRTYGYSLLFARNKFKKKQSNKNTSPIQSSSSSIDNSQDSDENDLQIEEIVFNTKSNTSDRILVNFKPYDKFFNLSVLWSKCRTEKIYHFLMAFDTMQLYDPINNKKIIGIYIIPIVVLRYLLSKNNYLTENDITAFVHTFCMVFKNKQSFTLENVKKLKIERRENRAIHLASLFLRGIETAKFINDVCGEPFDFNNFRLVNYFDGPVFSYLYERAYLNECHNLGNDPSTVKSLFDLITNDLEINFKNKPDDRLYHNMKTNPQTDSCLECDDENSRDNDKTVQPSIGRGRGLLGKSYNQPRSQPNQAQNFNYRVLNGEIVNIRSKKEPSPLPIDPIQKSKNNESTSSSEDSDEEKYKIISTEGLYPSDAEKFIKLCEQIPIHNPRTKHFLRFSWTEKLQKELIERGEHHEVLEPEPESIVRPKFIKPIDMPYTISKKAFDDVKALIQQKVKQIEEYNKAQELAEKALDESSDTENEDSIHNYSEQIIKTPARRPVIRTTVPKIKTGRAAVNFDPLK